ncbi:MAG: alpha/beta fold hydrolase [Bacilli bacterium]
MSDWKLEEAIKLPNGRTVFARIHVPSGCKGIVQIAHGMAEHSGCYQEWCAYLIENGYGYAVHDHAGHGQTAQQHALGHFDFKLGWEQVVDDVHSFTTYVKSHTSLPIFIMGHSMGSFLVRTLLPKTSGEYTGCILSGTGASLGLLGAAGQTIARVELTLRGEHNHSPLMEKLSFGAFNRRFTPAKTPFDWLSRDEEQVQAYIADPLCGFTCTSSFYYHLLRGIGIANRKETFERTANGLPILLFSGDQDPVGDFGIGFSKVVHHFKERGMKDVTAKLYPNGRHEMLHETNRLDVFKDTVGWLNRYTTKR